MMDLNQPGWLTWVGWWQGLLHLQVTGVAAQPDTVNTRVGHAPVPAYSTG